MKLLVVYENVTQEVLFGSAILAALMSGRKYDAMPQDGYSSREGMSELVFSDTKSVIKTQRRCRIQYGK
jgi:hypothetical protein